MGLYVHRWSLELASGTGRAAMLFKHHSRPTGTQVLDEVAWPTPASMQTEHQILQELWAAASEFMERRA